MADVPLVCNFQGDYGLKLLVVDDERTISEVIEQAADLLCGVVVPEVKDRSVLQARIQDSPVSLNRDTKVKDANLASMEAIEIYFGSHP